MRSLSLLACEAAACAASATRCGRLPAPLLPQRLRSAACGKPASGHRLREIDPTSCLGRRQRDCRRLYHMRTCY
ncbi:hypothetical protein B296_00046701 [Ensete ventricosum]|uniref:Uncharacterized protein n=1 Tax=Ensete ventricosum TaxID=4639 RepID=A0A426WZC0_ENSVE|nr:hypothetical protein B296_00046701 [Ensete ventricosum]